MLDFCTLFLLSVVAIATATPLLPLPFQELPANVLLKYTDVHVHNWKAKKKWSEKNVKRYYVQSRGSDGEFMDASNHFFWNKTDGIAMELGAVDGESTIP
jgi:hypothetical protein